MVIWIFGYPIGVTKSVTKISLKRGQGGDIKISKPKNSIKQESKEDHGGDEADLCDHSFKALEPLVSVYLEPSLYQKTCTRKFFKNDV